MPLSFLDSAWKGRHETYRGGGETIYKKRKKSVSFASAPHFEFSPQENEQAKTEKQSEKYLECLFPFKTPGLGLLVFGNGELTRLLELGQSQRLGFRLHHLSPRSSHAMGAETFSLGTRGFFHPRSQGSCCTEQAKYKVNQLQSLWAVEIFTRDVALWCCNVAVFVKLTKRIQENDVLFSLAGKWQTLALRYALGLTWKCWPV